MSDNDDFRIRPGRIRSTRAARTKPFLAQALQAAQKAGGLSRGAGGAAARSGVAARRALPRRGSSTTAPAAPWSRRGSCARCVRRARCAPISDISSAMGSPAIGRPGKLFDAAGDEADGRDFAERCEGRSASFPVHRLAGRCRRAIELAELYARTDGPGLARSRHAARLGRHRPLEHRAPPCPHPCARPRRRWQRPRHQPRLYLDRACAPVPATSSPVSSVRDQSSRFDSGLRRK